MLLYTGLWGNNNFDVFPRIFVPGSDRPVITFCTSAHNRRDKPSIP